ncbi:TLX3 [Branchiostoma lanceolatum]|uniref:TLX3 protein n=1 Tax=Branchiostoma lanceolatum TaxID=7740 RepID=A0A8K0ENG5_BRALA|nr:TLX3 [Branchiostoma lanceolatum]
MVGIMESETGSTTSPGPGQENISFSINQILNSQSSSSSQPLSHPSICMSQPSFYSPHLSWPTTPSCGSVANGVIRVPAHRPAPPPLNAHFPWMDQRARLAKEGLAGQSACLKVSSVLRNYSGPQPTTFTTSASLYSTHKPRQARVLTVFENG